MMNKQYDKEFLLALDQEHIKEKYARITALTKDELPLQAIEGRVTGGSLSVDGASAIRRTCNLTLVAEDVNLNNFYWGLSNKFKLEIGLKNNNKSKYNEDIIWFKQGIFVITSFNAAVSQNNFTISISGKDKMCLLNGEIAGSLPASIDFGKIDEYKYAANAGSCSEMLKLARHQERGEHEHKERKDKSHDAEKSEAQIVDLHAKAARGIHDNSEEQEKAYGKQSDAPDDVVVTPVSVAPSLHLIDHFFFRRLC
jgi:hypothetical protein